MKKLVKTNFSATSVSNLLSKAKFIVSELTAHSSDFPEPIPPLTAISTAITALETASAAAATGDRAAIAVRRERRANVETLLKKEAMYVEMQAEGNRAIASRSGYDLVKEPVRSAPIAGISTPLVGPGPNMGELWAKVRAVKGAKAYQFCISDDKALPVVQWKSYPVTVSRFRFAGLDSGKRYYISVAAVGINRQCVYSDITSFVTQ